MIRLFLFVLLGALASLLISLNEAYMRDDFKVKKFLKANALPTFTNIVIGCTLVACTYDKPNAFIEVDAFVSFMLGLVAQQFLKKLCNIFIDSKPTFIGINKRKNHESDTKTD